ncbi:Proline--tRNA ligase [Bertholletia excelsa]
MAYSKDQLLARLKELQINYTQYNHPVVMTVEEQVKKCQTQAKYVGHVKGALSKNLFLKDKKHRFYIVSALAETKIDLKVLSQRLGLGKAGLRMAPEEALQEILKVPLGSVTPFALVNDSARNVCLMLDKGFKDQDCCFFHPLSNDTSISLNASDLNKFLKLIGKDPAYVDLEANPPVGKDTPPDLAALVPSDAILLPEGPEKAAPVTTAPSQSTDKNLLSVNKKSVSVPAKEKSAKPSSDASKEKSASANLSLPFTEPEKFVEEILEKTSAVIISEIKQENIKLQGEELGALVSNSVKKHLSLDLINLATIFKNTAYSEGFHAGSRNKGSRCL